MKANQNMSCRVKITDTQSKKKMKGVYAKDILGLDVKQTLVMIFLDLALEIMIYQFFLYFFKGSWFCMY